jgi:hypothetical protein
LADRLPKGKTERKMFFNKAVEHELDARELRSRAGRTITPAKSAEARENGRPGKGKNLEALNNGHVFITR